MMLAQQPLGQMNWPEAAMMLGMFACLAFAAWCCTRESDGVTIWFRKPEEPFEPLWKGKSEGRKAGDPWPPAP